MGVEEVGSVTQVPGLLVDGSVEVSDSSAISGSCGWI